MLHSLLPRVRRSRRKRRIHRLLVRKSLLALLSRDRLIVVGCPGTSEKQEAQQQPGKPAAANAGGSVGELARLPQLAIKRDVLNPLLEACAWDDAIGAWLTPATEPDARLCGMDWRNMLKLPPGWTPTSFVPTFFRDEPDANQKDKHRLDIVVSFGNGHAARYHPSADPIWSTSPQPTDAMQKRYNRAKTIGQRGTGNPLHR